MASRLTTQPETPTILRFYNLKNDSADAALISGLRDQIITERDAVIIRTYLMEKKNSSNITILRSIKLAGTLKGWRRFIGPYECLTLLDVYNGIEKIKSANSDLGKPFSQNTIYDFIRILKSFLLWMIENEFSPLPEKKIQKIQPPPKNKMTKTAGDILTTEEIDRMLKACMRSRDRAMLSMLYEGGFRIGEIGTITWGDLAFDAKGVKANTDRKTGKPRYIRLVDSKPLLIQWMTDYPFEIKSEYPVFLTERNEPIMHQGVTKLLRRIADRADVKKKVNPHIFRHSRITHLIIAGLPDSIIKTMIWGNLTTEMFQTYAHLTGEDVDNAVMKMHGIINPAEAKKQRGMTPRQCPTCGEINNHTADFCINCMTALHEDATRSIESLSKDFMSNPQMLATYMTQIATKAAADAVAAERARIGS
ncbi:MAG: tyrosine-type recombinase/integrase [Methanomicrobiales archaeon]